MENGNVDNKVTVPFIGHHYNSALELSCEHLQSQHWIFRSVTLTSIPTPALPQDQA